MNLNLPKKKVLFDGTNQDATHEDTIFFMREYALEFSTEDWAKRLALEFLQHDDPIKSIFDYVYNIGVFKNDYKDQIIKTHNRAKKDGTLNCVQYSVLIGALLTAINEPFYFRAVDTDGEGFSHIYVKTTKGLTLDATLGQPINDNATFENRPKVGQFNIEYPYIKKLDTMGKSVILLNGRRSGSRNLNGFACSVLHPFNAEKRHICNLESIDKKWQKQQYSIELDDAQLQMAQYPAVTGTTTSKTTNKEKKGILASLDSLFSNLNIGCEQSCNLFHPFNQTSRNACMSDCAPDQINNIKGGSTLSAFMQDNGLLVVIAGAAIATAIFDKKTKRKTKR